MKYIYVLFFLSLGCNKLPKDIDSANSVKINIRFNEKRQITDHLEGITVVKLQTDKDVIIGEIKDLICKGDSLYILDANYSKSIFVFDKNGKKLYAINKFGKGPGEYIRPARMIVKDNIYLFDKTLGKIIIYNKEDGSFIREFGFKESAVLTDVAIADNILFAYTNNMDENNIHIFDMKGIKMTEYFPTPDYLKNKADFFMRHNFAVNNSEVLFMNAFDNNIYDLKAGRFSVKYNISFDKFNVPVSVLESAEKLDIGQLIDKLSNKYAYAVDYLVNDKNYLSFCFIKNGTNVAFYNKKSKNSIVLPLRNLTKEWLSVFRIPQFTSDNGFVTSLQASEMNEFLKMDYKEDKVLSKIKTDVQKLGKHDINDNPYLLFTKLKPF